MAKYCADCTYMETGGHKKGKFDCTNPKSGFSEVSARKSACGYITECFNSRRCQSEREALMEISRSYGCYIIGAIIRTLDLPFNEMASCLLTFKYYKEIMLPNMIDGEDWVEDYDKFGPTIASNIEGNENKCSYLYICYVRPFSELIEANEVDAARELYNGMYENLKSEYKLGQQPKKLVQRAS
ncbi:MAG: hypothetical protein J1F35_06875 [Erysipelotrichales bacterium]|nr:hypothetical protein [Erysipelotrichales bacterium]